MSFFGLLNHSTKTALVKVHNDIMRAIDDNRSVLLLLLDLSAAFDTVDHSTLLLRLRTRFGVKGSALAWFESYLASRKYYVQVEGYSLPFGPWILVYPRAQYWAHSCTCCTLLQ